MKVVLKTLVVTVTTAGTRVRASSANIWARGLSIKALAANAGVVYAGDSTVAAANGLQLAAGAVLSLPDVVGQDSALDLSTLYFDAATSGDKISLAYFEVVA